jgi:transposase
MITIDGLTKRQVKMLDKMWAIDGYDEYMEWKTTLCYAQKQQVDTLEQLVMLAETDQMVDDLTEANDVLKKVMMK